MNYYLAPSLVALRGEINARWPNRDKTSDGWIGDTAHSSRVSDHNPDEKGCVYAIDVDIDGINIQRVLNAAVGDPRVWYVIYNRIIRSRTYDWQPRAYTGSNPHDHHIHISIRYEYFAENDTSTWIEDHKRRTKGGQLPIVDLSNVLFRMDHPGDQPHEGIERIQRSLNARHGANLEVDGYWGEQTAHALGEDVNRKNLAKLGRGRFRVIA